jgi:hypothetical protein
MKVRIEYLADGDGGSIVYGFVVGLTCAPRSFDHPKVIDLFSFDSGRRIVLVPEIFLTFQKLTYLAGGYELAYEGEPGWGPEVAGYVFEAVRVRIDGRIRGGNGPGIGDLPGAGPEYRPSEDRPGEANVTRKARDGEGGGL